MRVQLVVDTGVDDALALIAAHLHPGLDVAGVCAAAGNVSLARSVANTAHVLGILDAQIPLARGAASRSDGRPFPRRAGHGPDGLAGVGPTRQPDRAALARLPSLRAQRAALDTDDGPPLLVCLAPLSSLLDLDPGPAVASFARVGQGNHAMDASAAERVVHTWDLATAPEPPALRAAPDLRSDTAVRGLARVLLDHQRARGAGLGDADVVLRLAGSTDPERDLLSLLRR